MAANPPAAHDFGSTAHRRLDLGSRQRRPRSQKRQDDVQSAVERELVLRLASLLWRLRRTTTMETGLFEIQVNHLNEFRQARQALPESCTLIHSLVGQGATAAVPEPNPTGPAVDPAVEVTRCFLRLANLPNFALDRLSRYEAILWRQARQILHALDALDRRKPQERTRSSVSMLMRHSDDC
jgi:hypothetical protein